MQYGYMYVHKIRLNLKDKAYLHAYDLYICTKYSFWS